MGKDDYKRSYSRQMESIIIILTTIYSLTSLILGYRKGWNELGQSAVFGGMMISWMFYFGKYATYEVRAYVISAMSQVTILAYALAVGDFYSVISVFISMCILLGLYGIPQVLGFPFLAYNLMLYYFFFINKSLSWGATAENMGLITRIFQGYLVMFVVFYLVYRYKISHESMLEMIDALRKSERQKDDFLANVSHEIRTPINTICGISEIMLKNEVPEEMKEDVLNIQSAGRNLMSVVGDILDYSELQEGEFEIVEENYYVSSTIYDVINMTMAKKSEKNIELIVNCAADMPSVLIGDEQKIRRVIMNLVNNAIEFTSEGCVSVEFGFRKEEYGINLIVSVKDTGIGMTQESVENLFKKFTQVDMGRTRKKGGVGLGLAISQMIVNKMGGFISVKSELGSGSEFRFVIPQKVYEEKPIVEIADKEKICAAVYINMEQFRFPAIRDGYTDTVKDIIKQLGVKCHVCRNLSELKRWGKREDFNQIFISLVEYQEDPVYFDSLARKANVHVIIDHHDDLKVQNKHISKIYKPFFILSIISALKNSMAELEEKKMVIENENHQLYAPEAHILVVDDNRMNIRVVEGLMREFGVQVSYALSGKEGMEMLQTKNYDLVLLDHMMPEMDGVETFHHIRSKQDSYFKEIPIIALTANAIAGAREMFMKEGFSDFLAKPVESSVLQRTLKRHIPKDKQVAANGVKEVDTIKVAPQQVIQQEPQQSVKEDAFVIGDLDVSKGIMYCGNKDNYIEILKSQKDNGEEVKRQIQSFFQKEDWKNYVITVHGIKSSMMSIGAVALSEMAKTLEFAGKAEDFDFIKNEHAEMIVEFERVMKILNESEYVTSQSENEEVVDKEAIAKEVFEQKLVDLENASYELDADKMKKILDEISEYSYGGKDMQKELAPVYKKVEMFDLMSAYETVAKIKVKLS